MVPSVQMAKYTPQPARLLVDVQNIFGYFSPCQHLQWQIYLWNFHFHKSVCYLWFRVLVIFDLQMYDFSFYFLLLSS